MRDKTLTQRVSELIKGIFDFKKKQFSGSGNTISYVAQTGDTWDVNETATTTGSAWYGKYGFLQCTFTADNQVAAFTTFEVTALINNQPYYLDTSGGNDGIVYTGMVGQQVGSITIAKYQEYISFGWGCNTGTNIKIKVRAVSVAKGTLTMTKTINGA